MKSVIKILLIVQFFAADMVAIDYGYFVSFTDKTGTPYSVDTPEDFLSARAIERRENQNISITETDLPVNPIYIDSLKSLGITVKHTTKWMNGCIVFSSDAALMDTLANYGFVSFVELTYKQKATGMAKLEYTSPKLKSGNSDKSEIYGSAFKQINTVNGIYLHNNGMQGEGKIIAIIDAGFYGVDNLPAFTHLWNNNQILGTKDFVNPSSNIFEEHAHGMNVLSIIGGKIEGSFLGTAPEAKFWLLRTEDAPTEYPIEADYWICAAEFADSAGVDVINTSLGYSTFDDETMNYTYSQLDGETIRISRAATIAASTGMIVIVSAGNEGNKAWHYISAPADAKNILTIGAMTSDSIKGLFSSFGPTADGRIKPDVTAMGVCTAVQDVSGSIETGNGTSFSAPVITGMAACLWQSLSQLSSAQVIDVILQSSSNYDNPDTGMGYGIPDFETAQKTSIIPQREDNKNSWLVYPNPFSNHLVFSNIESSGETDIEIAFYDITGSLKYSETLKAGSEFYVDIPTYLSNGMYILQIKENGLVSQHKLMKEDF